MAVIHRTTEHVKPKSDDKENRDVPTWFFSRSGFCWQTTAKTIVEI